MFLTIFFFKFDCIDTIIARARHHLTICSYLTPVLYINFWSCLACNCMMLLIYNDLKYDNNSFKYSDD